MSRGTPLGLKAKAVMEAGKLVGDDLILGVVRDELDKPAAAGGVIFDGVVRTIPQAEGMATLLGERGRQLDHVLFFDVPDAEILGRIERRRGIEGRADDDPAAVATPARRAIATRPRRSWPGTSSAAAWSASPRSARWTTSPRGCAAPLALHGSMITLKSPREIETMTHAGRIVAGVLAMLRRETRPGMSTEDLDRLAEAFIRSHPGATPSFKGLYGFPKTLCTSINEEIVHGIPSKKRVLREGNIVSVDVGVHFEGMHADSAATIGRGRGLPRGAAAARRDQRVPGGGSGGGARPAITSATSGTRCRRWPRRRGSAWCGSWWGTASGRGSTRSRRCRTTACRSAARGSSRG